MSTTQVEVGPVGGAILAAMIAAIAGGAAFALLDAMPSRSTSAAPAAGWMEWIPVALVAAAVITVVAIALWLYRSGGR